MAFTVAQVIEDARDQHESFDAQRTTDLQLLRQLNRYVRQLYYRAIERNSTLYSTALDIELPLADFDAGSVLPEMAYYQGGTVHLTGAFFRHEPFNLVPWANRFTPNMHNAGFILEGVLYLCGDAQDWTSVDKIVFQYAPEPTALADYVDEVPLSDGSKWACVTHLAWFMARRQGVYEGQPLNVRQFGEDWKSAEEEWLIEIAQHSRSEATYVRAEW